VKRTREDVIREIQKFLRDEGGAYDWDEFISVPINDRKLDAIRIECAELPDRYPPPTCHRYCADEGFRRLDQILDALEK